MCGEAADRSSGGVLVPGLLKQSFIPLAVDPIPLCLLYPSLSGNCIHSALRFRYEGVL